MAKIYISLIVLSSFFINQIPFLASAQAQDRFDLNGVWERSDDKAQINIKQTGPDVIATSDSPGECSGGGMGDVDPYFEFKGTIDGNQIFGEESAWCYSGSSNPDENGLFIEPFQSTISADGNQLTEFITDRFTGEEVSVSYSKISGPTSPTDELRNTFTSTLSQIEEPLTSLQENDLPRMLLLAGLGVAVIGGTAAYVKHRSSKKSQEQEQEQAKIEVVTRGGIE